MKISSSDHVACQGEMDNTAPGLLSSSHVVLIHYSIQLSSQFTCFKGPAVLNREVTEMQWGKYWLYVCGKGANQVGKLVEKCCT